ncbi:MAG: metallophosphoesterase, partial [Ignavibacteriaceae bacterium]
MHKLITVLFILISSVTIGQTKFAVIGDFGDGTFRYGNHVVNVANIVDSWNPEFIVTVGDNTYMPKKDNEADQYDSDVGQFYHQYIYPYSGQYGQGSTSKRFFPALGNHEYYEPRFGVGIQEYLDWFELPGNERYYNVRWSDDVEIFVINNYNGYSSKDLGNEEPDGWDANSIQAQWLQVMLSASTATYKLVFGHLPPYASGVSSSESLSARWPFKEWGADAMFAGHRHNYERLVVDEMLYFVNGAGGYGLFGFSDPILGSEVRIMEYGAMLVDANVNDIT